jgi:8-oxo-dGTP pyrophosphatase MutT (NUDIX family)
MEENKIKATIGIFAGIMNEENKLLLRRRTAISSIIGKSFKGCQELPGGGVKLSGDMAYCYLVDELEREVEEEVGIEIDLDPMPAMYPVFFGKTLDLALIVPVRVSAKPTKEGTKWVTLDELNNEAKGYKPANKKTAEDGQGIVSGWGKRMHCMALKTFEVLGDSGESRKAGDILKEIQGKW